jgi:hypothetical protein
MPKVIKPEDNAKREQILSSILEILGKKEGDTEVTFFLSKMDTDEEAQNKIYELEQDIKKYYICSSWTCFTKEKTAKRKWLGMIKYICKEHDKEIINGKMGVKDEETDKKTWQPFYKIIL